MQQNKEKNFPCLENLMLQRNTCTSHGHADCRHNIKDFSSNLLGGW